MKNSELFVRGISSSRRHWLVQMGAVASSAAMPLWVARASAQSSSPLSTLPRLALVIGNGKYADAPLKNSVNDAKAIAGQLEKVGFKVDLHLDVGHAEMADAIQTFTADLAKTRSAGLFYYAGHGAQLAWRNYLIPVDAVIDQLEDMRSRAIELNSLLQGLAKAHNPMNVIILDACRDNPFGSKVYVSQRGLSQFDAPPGSLIAYATSPGSTAADGLGTNGLYTESLLRELSVPAEKIEDVFKRVRLSVRHASDGRQIPWESTSLEEDFYFLPPKQIRKLSEEELEREFEAELRIWEKIKSSKDPEPIEDYLRQYPSGKFSELAQFRLDRLLADRERGRMQAEELARQQEQERLAALGPNPFSKGTARANTKYKIGDSYTYRLVDGLTKLESRYTETVTSVSEFEITFDDGRIIDPLGNNIKSRRENVLTPSQYLPTEYLVGKQWSTRSRFRYHRKGTIGVAEKNFRIVGRENITIPAGTFDAFKIEGSGSSDGGEIYTQTIWISPEVVRQPLVRESKIEFINISRRFSRRYTRNEREELVSYRQSD